MKRSWILLAALVLLAGCSPAAREPDALALVRVLGVDGGGPVTLTAVCGGSDQEDESRGQATAVGFGEARAQLPWTAREELSLTGVSYLIVGPDADLDAVLYGVLADAELGATATVWLAEEGAWALLGACEDPAADLELLVRQGVTAPTVAQTTAALAGGFEVTLPCLTGQGGRAVCRGERIWNREN